jgi:hypothetical protein
MNNNLQTFPRIEIIERKSLKIPSKLFEACKDAVSPNIFEFFEEYLLIVIRNMQEFKSTFCRINSKYIPSDPLSHLQKQEDMIRNILAIQFRHYFQVVEVDPFHNGKVDIKINNFDNDASIILIECLRWDTYSSNYSSKIEQIIDYLNGQTKCYIFSFIQSHKIDQVFANAWRQTKAYDPDCTQEDKRYNDETCSYYYFNSLHNKDRKITISHYFFDFFVERSKLCQN